MVKLISNKIVSSFFILIVFKLLFRFYGSNLQNFFNKQQKKSKKRTNIFF